MKPLRIQNSNATSRLGWRIEAKADRADIDLYDVIGEDFWGDGVSATDFVQQLRSLDVKNIDLHINSPGGMVDDALAMYNALQQHKASITAHVEGIAASAASFVAMAADNILIAAHARMMIHDAMSFIGIFDILNAAGIDDLVGQLESMREVLDSESNNIASIYAERCGGTAAEWRDRMASNGSMGMTYRGQDAVDIGLADSVEEAPAKATNGRTAAHRTAALAMTNRVQDDPEGPAVFDLDLIPSMATGYKPPLPTDFTRLVAANLPAVAKGAS